MSSDTFAEFLQRSAIAEWKNFYVDLRAINKEISSHLSDDKNPAIAAAFGTLSRRCVDYQLAVRCSFSDGWEFPKLAEEVLGGEHNAEKRRQNVLSPRLKRWLEGKTPTHDGDDGGALPSAAAAVSAADDLQRSFGDDGDEVDETIEGGTRQDTLYSIGSKDRFPTATAVAASPHPLLLDQTQHQRDVTEESRASGQDGRGLHSRLSLAVRSARCLVKLDEKSSSADPIACTIRWRAEPPAATPLFLSPAQQKRKQKQQQQAAACANANAASNEEGAADNEFNEQQQQQQGQQEKLSSNLLFVMPCTAKVGGLSLGGYWVFRLVQSDSATTVTAPSPMSPPKRVASAAVMALLEAHKEQQMQMQRQSKMQHATEPIVADGMSAALAGTPAGAATSVPASQHVPAIVEAFIDITNALSQIQISYRRLARVVLFEVRKVSDFYARQSEVIASAVASCVDAAKNAKFFSDRSRALFVTASRESFNALDTMQEFCETNVLGLTKAMDALEQARKQHAVLDSADAMCRLPFALTKNSGLQLLRGDLMDAFRRSYLVVRLVPNSVLKLEEEDYQTASAQATPRNDDENKKASATLTSAGATIVDEQEMTQKDGFLSASNVDKQQEEKQKQQQATAAAAAAEEEGGDKKKVKKSRNFLKHPISMREARRLLQNSGGSSAAGGGGLVGGAAGGGGGGGGGSSGDGDGDGSAVSVFDFFWTRASSSFFLLFGINIGLLCCAATDFFALQEDPTVYIRHAHNNAWWHFYVWLAVSLMLIMWATSVSVWEAVGVNFVFLFKFFWDKWILLRNSMLYFFWWCLCAYAYCNRARYEQRSWMLLSVQNNFTMGVPYKIINGSVASPSTSPLIPTLPNGTAAAGLTRLSLFDHEAGPTAAAWVFPFMLWPLFGLTFIYFQFIAHEKGRRRWLLPTLLRVIQTPRHSVTFSDFIVCANLITLGAVWFEFQYFWCYLHPTFTENLEHPMEGACLELRATAILFLRALPLIWRTLQCFRNYYAPPAAKRTFFPHCLNGIKYIVVIFALLSRMFIGISKRTHEDANERGHDWLGVNHSSQAVLDAAVVIFYVIRTVDAVFRSTWDVYIDFALGPYVYAQQPVAVKASSKKPAAVTVELVSSSGNSGGQECSVKTVKVDSGSEQQQQQQEEEERHPKHLRVSQLALDEVTETVITANPLADDRVALTPATHNRLRRALIAQRRRDKKKQHAANEANMPNDAAVAADDDNGELEDPLSPTIFIEPPSSSSSDDDDDNDDDEQQVLVISSTAAAGTADADGKQQRQQQQPVVDFGGALHAPDKPRISTRGMFVAASAAKKFMRLRVDATQRTLGIQPQIDVSSSDDEEQAENSPSAAPSAVAAAEKNKPSASAAAAHSSPSAKESSDKIAKRLGAWRGPCGYIMRPMLLPMWCYPVFITVDILIRFSWLARYHLAVSGWGDDAPMRRSEAIPFIFICIVILRRFLWMLVRVENEMCNNIETYKQTRAAPPLRISNLLALKKQQGGGAVGDDAASGGGGGALGNFWDDAAGSLALINVDVAVAEGARAAKTRTVAAQSDFAQSSIDKFFALLPQEEKLAICSIALPLTHRRPPDGYEFTGRRGEGKSAWFASLRAEMKVHALLRRTGDKTLSEFAAAVASQQQQAQ